MTKIFGIVVLPLAWLLKTIYGFIGSYGLSLIIVTVIIKLALYPLYKKQILSTAGMADLQPKMKELQRKYANEPALLREKTAELYSESGINPAGGCLPMFIQMIVIMGLFSLLRTPLAYLTSEKMVFAIHEQFLWVRDLSQPDLWILPILAALATFLSFFLNSQSNPAMAGQSQGMMNIMKYVFPIMILWLARSYPAGLAVYWFIGQVVQIGFNFRFNKLRKNLEKNKKKRA